MDPYSVLRVSREEDLKDIRKRYKEMLLQNHPDTCKGTPKYTVDQINAAYKALLDAHNPASSPQAAASTLDVRFSDIRDLAEFTYNEEEEEFTRPCRCGQEMVFTLADLDDNDDADEIAIQCLGCSLWVLVQYEIEGE